MLKRSILLLAIALFTTNLFARTLTDDYPLAAGLIDIIQLQEQTEKGDTLNLTLGTIPQDVDINSIIRINIAADKLLQKTRFKAKAELRTEHQVLLNAANELEQAADLLTEGLLLASELKQNKRGKVEFKQKATQIQSHYKRSAKILDDYLDILKQSNVSDHRTRSSGFRTGIIEVITSGKQWEPLIANEIKWIIKELEKAGQTIIRDSEPVALNLVACIVPCSTTDPGSRIHLEHYDSIEPGVPQPFNKLNVVPSPEQVEKLKVAYNKTKEIADKLNDIESSREQLKESLNVILKQHGIDFSELKEATKDFKQEIENFVQRDWRTELNTMQERIEQALRNSPGNEQRQKLTDVKNRLNKIKSEFAELERSITAIKTMIDAFEPGLDKAALKSQADPVDALLALFEQITAVQTVFIAIQDAMKKFTTDTKTFANNFKQLPNEIKLLLDAIQSLDIEGTIKNELDSIASDFKQQNITPIEAALKRVQTAVNDIQSAINKLSNDDKRNLNAYASTKIEPPDTSYFVPLIQAKNTWIDLRTITEKEDGKAIQFQASLYHVKQEGDNYVPTRLLDREAQTFRTLRYGFYGEYNVGLAYVRSDDIIAGQTEEHRGFAPQVSWIMRHRSWRDVSDPAQYRKPWYDHVGFGIHTVALDMDNNNESEIGLGVTLSFIDELLQFGYGVDLSNDEKYYFIATRLFDF